MRGLAALVLVALSSAVAVAQTPPDRPNYFGLYPPPPRGTFIPTKPPPSTALREPDLFQPIPLYPNRDTVLYDGAIDWRYRNSTRETRGSYISSGRFTLEYIRANPKDGDERGGVRVQVLAESDSPANTSIEHLRLSEVYGFYKFLFPGVSASVRAGQFVLPFGLAAVYDTPLQPIQPLYPKSLGLRVDSGAMLEGRYGPYYYAAAVTTGSGPNRSDFDGNKVVSFRLQRSFLTQSGRIQLGGSMLTGRGPVTTFDTELPASGTSRARDFIDKTRFGADGSYYLAKLTARGEIIFGADGQDPVWGYFGEANYPAIKRVTAVATMKSWKFGDKPQSATSIGLGANYNLGAGVTLRTLYEYERDVPSRTAGGKPRVEQRVTVQTRLNF